jgi:hypothetical protein
MINNLVPRAEILSYLSTHYGVKESYGQNLIKQAYKSLSDQYKLDSEFDVFHKHIQQYYLIAANARQLGDNSSAIKALQAIEKLLKLTNDAPLIQNNTMNLNLKDLSVEDLKQLLTQNNIDV